ncbi:hypothetical protein ACF1GT_18985 [Streptomyces sp. NPDC014636]|uniref:hypothetical protein n=1 Tax=Streptomyces sp. NPDC014636 TaxID=3364876 RepID=UPI0036FE7677
MGGWISVGLGAAAVLCPLSQHGDTTVALDHMSATARLVVCAPDVWIDMGDGPVAEPEPARPAAAPAPRPATPQPATPQHAAPAPVPPVSGPPRPAARHPREPAPEVAPPAATSPGPATVAPSDREQRPSPAPLRAPAAFRWVPRSHYTGGPRRPAVAGTPMTMTMAVVTTPAVLAAAVLRPGSRRRGRG